MEKEQTFVKINEKEKTNFIENLREAEIYLKAARLDIAYSSFPDINKGAVGGLTSLINDVSRMIGCVTNEYYIILKPEVSDNEDNKEQLYYIRDLKGNIWDTGLTYEEAEMWIDNHEGRNYVIEPNILI